MWTDQELESCIRSHNWCPKWLWILWIWVSWRRSSSPTAFKQVFTWRARSCGTICFVAWIIWRLFTKKFSSWLLCLFLVFSNLCQSCVACIPALVSHGKDWNFSVRICIGCLHSFWIWIFNPREWCNDL